MPSKSEAQHRLMEAAAHTPGGYGGVPQSVGQEFVRADEGKDAMPESARETDINGYVTVRNNPITKAGVFQYLGDNLPGGEPGRIYNVYRPLEEVTAPETMESFKNLPIIDDHEMLGDGFPTAPEEKGIHGTTLSDVAAVGDTVMSSLRIFSRTLKWLIETGKKGISLGYRCAYEKSSGVFNGMTYDYIQREIRGNHLAIVNEGRCGTAVLDHHWALDHFDLALDNAEEARSMENEETTMDNEAAAEGEKEMTLAECAAAVKALLPLVKQMQDFMAAKEEGAEKAAEVMALDEESEAQKEQAKEAGMDEETEENKKEGEAMDAAIKQLNERIAKIEARAPKSLFAAAAARDSRAKAIESIVGSFNYAAMDEAEVVKYGIEKLGIKAPAGAEAVALDFYLAGRKEAEKSAATFAVDRADVKSGGLFAKTLGLSA